MENSQEHLKALKNVAEMARNLERVLSSTGHPGIQNEKETAIDKLKKAVHALDEIEGKRVPVGKKEQWEE